MKKITLILLAVFLFVPEADAKFGRSDYREYEGGGRFGMFRCTKACNMRRCHDEDGYGVAGCLAECGRATFTRCIRRNKDMACKVCSEESRREQSNRGDMRGYMSRNCKKIERRCPPTYDGSGYLIFGNNQMAPQGGEYY